MGKADLHIHTTYSHDGTASVQAVLEYVRQHTDLDVIAITDHDEIEGALLAIELAPQYGLDIVPGIEISTADGHLLALFVNEIVPRDMSLIDTVHHVAELGGLCIAAHPGSRWEWCLDAATLHAALRVPAVAETLVGLETYNASLPWLRDNHRAARIGQELSLAAVGSSDAHLPWMVGVGATTFPGASAEALRVALERRLTTPLAGERPWHFVASYLKHRLLRSLRPTTTPMTARSSRRSSRRLAEIKKMEGAQLA